MKISITETPISDSYDKFIIIVDFTSVIYKNIAQGMRDVKTETNCKIYDFLCAEVNLKRHITCVYL